MRTNTVNSTIARARHRHDAPEETKPHTPAPVARDRIETLRAPKPDLRRFVARDGHARTGGELAARLTQGGFDVNEKRYRKNVEILAGERKTTVVDPDGTKREVTFRDRFVPSKTHQLNDVLAWLGAQYTRLGLDWKLEPVKWKKETYYNLVVTVAGDSPEAVLLADHYDVADKEPGDPANLIQLSRDFGLSQEQIDALTGTVKMGEGVPGADDNASATAALIEMAHLIKAERDRGMRFEKTIKLVHLVGEEMPSDCLGGRAYVRDAKKRGDEIAGVIVMDMIGVDREKTKTMQISPGNSAASRAIAAQAEKAVGELGLDLNPVIRPFGSKQSYLHQTDGIIFSKAGYPVILLNEHMNEEHDFYRVGYHDEFDVTALMDFDFATDITRTALRVAYELAGAKS